jgi:hypothetical protein
MWPIVDGGGIEQLNGRFRNSELTLSTHYSHRTRHTITAASKGTTVIHSFLREPVGKSRTKAAGWTVSLLLCECPLLWGPLWGLGCQALSIRRYKNQITWRHPCH